MMLDLAKQLYLDVLTACLPVAFYFGMCNLIVSTALRAGLGGKLWLGSK